MNSMTSSQPAINGLIKKKTIGLIIRKAIMATLYQSGAFPRKFLIKAFPRDIGMVITLTVIKKLTRICASFDLNLNRFGIKVFQQ
jgi:hypothetical protein